MKLKSVTRAAMMVICVASTQHALADVDGLNRQAERAVPETKATVGAQDIETASSLRDRGMLYWNMGRYDEALPLFQQELAIQIKTLGPVNNVVAWSLHHLGMLYQDMGRYDEALQQFQRALAVREEILGPDYEANAKKTMDPNILGDLGMMIMSMYDLAGLYKDMGRYNEALQLMQRVRAIYENVLGPDNVFFANSLSYLAKLYQNAGRYDEALPLLQRAQAIYENVVEPDSVFLVDRLSYLAKVYQDMGRYDEALPLVQRAQAIKEKAR